MEQSLYIDYIKKYFPKLVLGITEKINGKENPDPYYFKNLLGVKYSPDGRWETLTGDYTRVSADIVAMDSPLPLKSRDTLSRANGNLPKIGMELYLNEKQMSDIDAMIAMQLDISTITSKIFEDTPRVITGVMERLEYMTLRGLSHGVALADTENVGTGVRVDYGYLTSNQFGVKTLWSTPATATPIDDIQKVVNQAASKGLRITKAYTDQATVNAMLATDQMKQKFAFSLGMQVVPNSVLPTPSREQANAILLAEFGITLEIVSRSVITQIDGVNTPQIPWKAGTIVFTVDQKVGDIIWTRLAEQNHPVAGVEYQTADTYILVSKYRTNRPSLREYTTSQARAIPVITNVDRIFTLDTKTVQA